MYYIFHETKDIVSFLQNAVRGTCTQQSSRTTLYKSKQKKFQIPLKFILAVTSNQKLSPEKGWIFRKFSSQNIDTHNGK